ncbi:DMT family transporter [Blochmannia endosymbiont of Camponotus (Colobopsis) obliquus]|uniref:DMT family transporter n=1 Tax=Blochmannia endosymbiont of Camponotus (Colobopsis) obliquus TaxID=1505597 RepID=UPI00061A5D17|nr:DMT family transporter [Blochmannia endosymbiont of Camponotus (Colobopsis) obliquus]AKC60473.1 inner membrane protein ytfF [Blochmannia endosymbiont of Camponotus (Colobopsis) obliquus]
MFMGFFFAVLAGFLWGLIFIGPLLLPEYPSALQSAGRYTAFGLISLLLSWYDRNRLRKLLFEDWIEAAKLVFVGNFIYYTCLTNAIQQAGAPVSTMIVGTLPIVITITYNIIYTKNEEKVPLSNFLLALILVLLGLILINVSEFLFELKIFNIWSYIRGIFSAIVAVICWTWYALRNAIWLRTHPYNKPTTWATAQGVVTLPLSIVAYFVICCVLYFIGIDFELPLGPRPKVFVPLMVMIGLLCSWLGTFCWNEASQRLPTVIVGPLIVFETLAALLYIFLHRQIWPSMLTICGVLCLMVGIIHVVNIKKV